VRRNEVSGLTVVEPDAGKKCVAVKLARAKVALQTAMKTTCRRKRGMGRREYLKTENGRGGQKKAARWIPRG
jgi:peptide subunit release factor RF-3